MYGEGRCADNFREICKTSQRIIIEMAIPNVKKTSKREYDQLS